MDIEKCLNKDTFKSRLLSQLSKEEMVTINQVVIDYDTNYVNKYTDEVCNRIFVKVLTNVGDYAHGWVFDNPLNPQEVRFCLRWMRRCLKRHLRKGNYFEIVKINDVKNNMKYDQITKFYSDDGAIEAESFYYNGLVNWLLSYGFTNGSLGEMRKSKSSKTKKPFFSLSKGWYSYGDIE